MRTRAPRQWGRDRLAAEGAWSAGCPPRPPRVNGAATVWPRKAPARYTSVAYGGRRQWGRDRLAAEGWGAAHNEGRAPASMGPRPFGRGRRGTPRVDPRMPGGVNGAATVWPRKVAGPQRVFPRDIRVNGAATVWPRKGLVSISLGDACTGVNGAATVWPRKGRPPMRSCRRGHSVNGAATVWPRKAETLMKLLRERVRQWGRDRLAAEGCGCPCKECHCFRVNGAATVWPRKVVDPFVGSGTTCGVNGAATVWPRKAACGYILPMPAPSVNGAATVWPRKGLGKVREAEVNA